jgi:hypothetical protein
MYFRFVAQSSRSKSIILVVTKVSSRPGAVIGVGVKWSCKKVEFSLHNSTNATIRGELTDQE